MFTANSEITERSGKRAQDAARFYRCTLTSSVCPESFEGTPTGVWTPAPKEGAPAWEILPQEAKPGEVILSKRKELGLLSNFAATPFVFRGQRYASLEGFWQMMLYPESAADSRATFRGLTWKSRARRSRR